jgi:hypothetical protein
VFLEEFDDEDGNVSVATAPLSAVTAVAASASTGLSNQLLPQHGGDKVPISYGLIKSQRPAGLPALVPAKPRPVNSTAAAAAAQLIKDFSSEQRDGKDGGRTNKRGLVSAAGTAVCMSWK